MNVPLTNSLVSIGIPTYNSAKFLGQCLDSIAAQTYENIEVVICDNASTDGTVTLANEYVRKYGFQLHVNNTNLGAGANFNRIISLAKGDYIAIYHADDVYENTIVVESANALNNNESIGLVGTMGSVIDGESKYLHDFLLHDDIRRLHKTIFAFDEALLGAIRNCFITPSVMVRKQAYNELGGFDQQRYRSSCDYEMWLRIAKRYNVAIIDKRLIKYRVHENQGSEQEIRKNVDVPDIVWVLREYRRYIADPSIRNFTDRIIDKWILKSAKKQNYLGLYAKSSETLKEVQLIQNAPLKLLFSLLNTIGISMKKRSL